MEGVLFCYTDGASRGNPGPAAWAFLVGDEEGRILAEGAGLLGRMTNNEAEYHAVINALGRAKVLHARRVVLFSDSELVIRQLRGEYQVRKAHLHDLFLRVKDLEQHFLSVDYQYVRREHPLIQAADKLCNRALDSLDS